MKKFSLVFAIFFFFIHTNAQNIFPSTGKVGIGDTTSLTRILNVFGGINIYGNGTNDVGLFSFHPIESSVSNERWFLRADLTNNASYPYLTNRTPNGKIVFKSGGSTAGSENIHFTIEGGDNIVSTYFENVKLGINQTSDLNATLTVNGDFHIPNGAISFLGNGNNDYPLLRYNPVENSISTSRAFLRADITNNASYPYLTNRTPSGKVVIKTGTTAGAGENTHFTIEGGDNSVNAYFENVNLGINQTSNLNAALTVNGDIEVPNGEIIILGNGNTDFPMFRFPASENGSTLHRPFFRADITNNASYPYLTNRTPSGKVVIKTGTAAGGGENTHFTIEGGDNEVKAYFENVKLGIGTAAPTANLHIYEGDTGPTLRLDAATDKNPNINFSVNGQNMANIKVNDSGDNQFMIQVGSPLIDAMSITETGNVGIGVILPDSKLVVDGKIKSEEIKVEVINAPDYVFEEDYPLRSIEETDQFIKQHKHLPEIPSAKEMESNGVELGEMNMKLLKKVEELTLYLIEQNKEIKSLKKEVENLKKKNRKAPKIQ